MIILNQTNVSNELAAAPVGKLLFKLAVPTVIAQLVNLLYNIVDRIYIGHMPGTGSSALTGIGLCFPIIYLISAFSALIGQGGAPRAAICMGQNKTTEANRILNNCFVVLIIEAVILSVFFWIFGEPLLWLFGCSEQTIVYALPYMQIYVSGSIFVMLALGLNLFITTQGFTRFSMTSVLIGAGANIILDPIFIYGLHMGVRGAALATIISQGLSCIWILRFLTGKKTRLRLKKSDMHLEKRIVIPCLGLGLGPFVMQATDALLNIAFNSSLQHYGGDIAVGCMTISSTIQQMVWIPVQGIGQGAQPIISYNFGAGKFDRVKMTIKRMISITFLAAFVYVVFAMLRPGLFARLFTTDEDLIALVKKVLPVYIAGMSVFGVQSGVQSSFLGLGQAKISLCIALLRKVILLIPLALILPRFFGVMGVYYAEPVADILSVLTASTLFLLNIRKILSKEMLAKVTHTT